MKNPIRNPGKDLKILFAILFTFLFIPEITFSQDLLTSRRSSFYTLIYKLTSNNTEKLLKGNRYKLNQDFLHTVIDSFPTGSQYKSELLPGHYLFLHISGNQAKYNYVNVSTFDINILNNNRDLIIEVFNKESNSFISNAIIKFNNHKVPFDNKTNTYILSKQKKRGFLKIQVGDETLFRDIEKESYWRRSFFHSIAYGFPLKYVVIPIRNLSRRIRYSDYEYYRNYRKVKAKGYIAFNKPKYLPNDTVKIKAFLVSKHGRIINDKVKLLFKESIYDDTFVELAEISPTTSGSYLYELPLSDTLQIDKYYTIVLTKGKKEKTLLYDSFRIEDYQLDETSYEIKPNKETTYHRGEPVIFYALGKDANGLNVLDGNIEITLESKWIDEIYDKSVFIRNTLWKHTQKLDPIGKTKIIVPDSIFPKASFTVRVQAKFNNSNNEIHNESFSFDYNGKEKIMDVFISENLIHCNLTGDHKTDNIRGSCTVLRSNDTLSTKQITFPFHEKLNTNVSKYIFTAGEEIQLYSPSIVKDSISTYFYQQEDSVYFGLSNPHKINIHYNIYRGNNEEIERGVCQHLNWSAYNPEKTAYHISYQYLWAGEQERINNSVFSFENNLNINITQPDNIDPGQTVNVEIEVNDIDNKPVEGVNLTASAINAQFDEKGYPDPPYLGKSKRGRKYYNSYNHSVPNIEIAKYLDPFFQSRFKLDTIAWYKLFYPENGNYFNYDSTGLDNAQFFPHLRSGNFNREIKFIYIDNKFMYYSEADNSNSGYSIIALEGYHSVTIRSGTNIYTIDSVLFKKGFKLDLSLDVDNIPNNVEVKKTKNKLSEDEKDLLMQNMIWVKNNFRGIPTFLWQGDKVYFIDRNNRQYYFIFGPFNNDSIHFARKDQFAISFKPQHGYEYTFDKDTIKINDVPSFDGYKSGYYSLRSNINPGQRAFPTSAIILESEKSKWDNIELESGYYSGNKATGELRIRYSGDSTFFLTRLIQYDENFNPKYHKGSVRSFKYLPYGYYQILFITAFDNILVKDSIFIQPDGINYYLLEDDLYITSDSLQPEQNALKNSAWEETLPAVLLAPKSFNLSGNCTLKGKVLDAETNEPIPFANVVVLVSGSMYAGATTDFDGNYYIKGLNSGNFEIQVTYVGYKSVILENVHIATDQIRFLDFELENSACNIEAIMIVDYRVPLIDKDRTVSGGTVTAYGIAKMPNRNASSVATTVGGVYSKDGLRGARSEQRVMYLDDNGDLSISLLDEQSTLSTSNIRKDFKDYAYWQPDLISDKNGHASFQIKFPDNITKWKTFVLAMDGKKNSGVGTTETRAIKSLVANLAVPRFFVKGDESNVIGKILNYKNNPEKINTSFYINDELITSTDTLVRDALIENFKVKTKSTDTIILKYILDQEKEGISDGEERKVPVFPEGVEETKGKFCILDSDTTFYIPYDSTVHNLQIYAANSTAQFMLKEIKKLKEYPHYCMEQSASKLRGFLAEEKIMKQTGERFNNKGQIRKMIRKLEKGQNKAGEWGWWPFSSANIWMTAYISIALAEATEAGYATDALTKSTQVLVWHLDISEGPELLYAINALSEIRKPVDYCANIKKLEKDSLSLHNQFVLEKIKQQNKLEFSLDEILNQKKETVFGNYYWGNENNIYYNNSIDLTILAYQIIEASDSLHPALRKIRHYLINRSGNQRKINTYQTASMLQTILPGALRDEDQLFTTPKLDIFEELTIHVSDFPFSKNIENQTQEIQVVKSGSTPVYFTWYSSFWNNNPEPVDSIFKIDTWFETQGEKLKNLEAGENTVLYVKVNALKKADYVMLEVPIPAGCSYGNKKGVRKFNETHREYYKNKTIIYCETLETGEHIFKINLQARFTGTYTLNPAKLELMYFPTFFGRNAIEKVIIESE